MQGLQQAAAQMQLAVNLEGLREVEAVLAPLPPPQVGAALALECAVMRHCACICRHSKTMLPPLLLLPHLSHHPNLASGCCARPFCSAKPTCLLSYILP